MDPWAQVDGSKGQNDRMARGLVPSYRIGVQGAGTRGPLSPRGSQRELTLLGLLQLWTVDISSSL
jgi:hypothetical protein